VTILDFVFQIFVTNIFFDDVYRGKNRLKFNYNQEEKTILLTDCNMDKAKKAIHLLKTKLK